MPRWAAEPCQSETSQAGACMEKPDRCLSRTDTHTPQTVGTKTPPRHRRCWLWYQPASPEDISMIPNCLNCGPFSPFCLGPFQTSSSPEKRLLFLDVVNTCLELTGTALVCICKCKMNCFTGNGFPQSSKAHTCRNI